MSAFVAPPAGWSAAFLDTAIYLDLHVEPSHQDAAAFVDTLIRHVIAADVGRKNQRSTTGMTKIQQTVEAIVGGVLRAWGQDGSPAYRSNHADAFTPAKPRLLSGCFGNTLPEPGGRPPVVGRRMFTTVIAALKAKGLLHHKEGLRFH